MQESKEKNALRLSTNSALPFPQFLILEINNIPYDENLQTYVQSGLNLHLSPYFLWAGILVLGWSCEMASSCPGDIRQM